MTDSPHATAAGLAESVHEQDAHRPGVHLVQGVGMAHIVVGASLLLGGMFYALAAVGPVLLEPWLVAGAARARQNTWTTVQAYEQSIASFEQQIERTEDEATKESLRANIEFYQSQIDRMLTHPARGPFAALQTPLFWICVAADIGTGLLLNLLLLRAGIGLLSLREKSRRLAVWVCVLKVVRLAVLCCLYLFIVGPVWAAAWNLTFAPSAPRDASRPYISPTLISGNATGVSFAVCGFLMAAAYPILSGLFLCRAESRQVCQLHRADDEQDLSRPTK